MTCLQNSNTSLTRFKASQPDDSNRHNHRCENLKSLPILDNDHFDSHTHTHTHKKNPLVGAVLKQTNIQHLVQMPTYCLKGTSQRRRTCTYKTGMMMKHVSHKCRVQSSPCSNSGRIIPVVSCHVVPEAREGSSIGCTVAADQTHIHNKVTININP